jgi:hypothetical protein
LESLNLEQAAVVFWATHGRVPVARGFAWECGDRAFEHLHDAIHFVLDELTDGERATAVIVSQEPRGILHFRQAGIAELARIIVLIRSLRQELDFSIERSVCRAASVGQRRSIHQQACGMASNLEREVRRNLELRQELGVEVAKGLAVSKRRPAYEADTILNLKRADIVD